MTIASSHSEARPSPVFTPPPPSAEKQYYERSTPLTLSLIELNPQDVVEGLMTEKGFVAAEVTPVGPMREACPHCSGVALQLVLRHRHVKRSHLFCRVCTRCYDAVTENGHSVLML
ncbi:hypothetical protein PQR62_21605 [Herbaspirillum lusitanum]|uniref:Uncharacterized protein n=1 Tax=Herbaspirillum lusitanum TaxID=213312 RepID=A0ABW9AHF6_9BURK